MVRYGSCVAGQVRGHLRLARGPGPDGNEPSNPSHIPVPACKMIWLWGTLISGQSLWSCLSFPIQSGPGAFPRICGSLASALISHRLHFSEMSQGGTQAPCSTWELLPTVLERTVPGLSEPGRAGVSPHIARLPLYTFTHLLKDSRAIPVSGHRAEDLGSVLVLSGWEVTFSTLILRMLF